MHRSDLLNEHLFLKFTTYMSLEGQLLHLYICIHSTMWSISHQDQGCSTGNLPGYHSSGPIPAPKSGPTHFSNNLYQLKCFVRQIRAKQTIKK